MKRTIGIFLALTLIFVLSACECKHKWNNSSCESPKTCLECGATDGEALGHDWISATCTVAKTCSRCQATQGQAKGHSVGIGICPTCGDRSDILMDSAVAIINAESEFTEKFGEGLNYLQSSFQFSTDKYQANYVDKAYISFSAAISSLERAKGYCGNYKEFESTKQKITEIIELLKPKVDAYPWSVGYVDFRTNIVNIIGDIRVLTQELMIPQEEWVK